MDNPKANIKLKEGANPATISGHSRDGSGNKFAFPTERRQKAGWNSKTPKEIVRAYPDRYELINGGGGN